MNPCSMTELVEIPSSSNLLTGIVHPPAKSRSLRIGVLISSTNIPPKSGPHRLFVSVAEALSRAGFYALRYDNHGTDDSPGIQDLTFAGRVADARAVMEFFRSRYALDVAIGWGLCGGAAVTVHAAADSRQTHSFDGLVLCNLLAASSTVWDKRVGARTLKARDIARQILGTEDLLRKLMRAPRKLGVYLKKVPGLVGGMLEHFRKTDPEIPRMRAAIADVGQLLAEFPGPCLMVFGEKDPAFRLFQEEVNPGDRLGLGNKKIPPELVLIKDGDHSFASREQTEEVIRRTLEWFEKLAEDRYLWSAPSPRHAPSLSSPATRGNAYVLGDSPQAG